MELSKNYIPGEVEIKWYKHWVDSGYFHSTPNDKKAYTVVIPPPNVTGVLHRLLIVEGKRWPDRLPEN